MTDDEATFEVVEGDAEEPDFEAAEEEARKLPPRVVKKRRSIAGAAMLGLGRALGQIYDPKPPPDIEIEQEASDDLLDPDQPVRIQLGDTPQDSVARVRRTA